MERMLFSFPVTKFWKACWTVRVVLKQKHRDQTSEHTPPFLSPEESQDFQKCGRTGSDGKRGFSYSKLSASEQFGWHGPELSQKETVIVIIFLEPPLARPLQPGLLLVADPKCAGD